MEKEREREREEERKRNKTFVGTNALETRCLEKSQDTLLSFEPISSRCQYPHRRLCKSRAPSMWSIKKGKRRDSGGTMQICVPR